MKENIFIAVFALGILAVGAYYVSRVPTTSTLPTEQAPAREATTTTTHIVPEPAPVPATPQKKCFVSGCSSQICSDEPSVMTTCEYREEYACYTTATCERQASGQCGWTVTPELAACLSRAKQ